MHLIWCQLQVWFSTQRTLIHTHTQARSSHLNPKAHQIIWHLKFSSTKHEWKGDNSTSLCIMETPEGGWKLGRLFNQSKVVVREAVTGLHNGTQAASERGYMDRSRGKSLPVLLSCTRLAEGQSTYQGRIIRWVSKMHIPCSDLWTEDSGDRDISAFVLQDPI